MEKTQRGLKNKIYSSKQTKKEKNKGVAANDHSNFEYFLI